MAFGPARRADLRLLSAADGNLGIEFARAYQPEVILMDINLPGISGIEATRRITTAHPEVVVMLLSTYNASDLPTDAASCGAASYTNKEDFSPDVVEQVWAARNGN